MSFEWDPEKAEANFRKHGIDFADARKLFQQPHFTEESFLTHEMRFVSVGYLGATAIAVVWTPRGEHVRIISARRARREEREAYRAGVGR